ncbi:MAG: ComF family protein [Desulfovibrio sp.]|uniref:ComF family protein n=1 Tax=Desulfovibrio sp. 7SRBS1 TaxID=3378064 RepID=UPI003B3E647F
MRNLLGMLPWWLSGACIAGEIRIGRVASLLAQSRCPVCSRVLSERDALGLCPECRARLAPRTAGYCPACGLLHADPDGVPHLCATCLDVPPDWENIYFHGSYDGLLGELLRAYKFRSALGLGKLLQSLVVETFFLREYRVPDLIVPVPLHPRRLLERGYNQSRELGRRLAARLERPLTLHALERVRCTIPQVSLERKDRLRNVQGAFQAREGEVAGRRVLLLDDVMTTGTTLRECTRVLLQAGAAAVDVLVLARA